MDNLSALAAYLAADNYRAAHAASVAQAAECAARTRSAPAPAVTDGVDQRPAHNYLADLGAGSSFLAGAFGAGAGVAASLGSDHIALGFAAAAGVAGAVGGIGEFVDHLRDRGKEKVADPALNDAAAATGVIAGGLGAGAGLLAMIPGFGHAAIGLGVLAGVSGAVDGVLDIVDHRRNEQGFSTRSLASRDVDSATNGIAGTLGAVASIAPAIPGGAAVAGVAAGVQGVAHIVHHLLHRDDASDAGGATSDGHIEGQLAHAAAVAGSAGSAAKIEVVG